MTTRGGLTAVLEAKCQGQNCKGNDHSSVTHQPWVSTSYLAGCTLNPTHSSSHEDHAGRSTSSPSRLVRQRGRGGGPILQDGRSRWGRGRLRDGRASRRGVGRRASRRGMGRRVSRRGMGRRASRRGVGRRVSRRGVGRRGH